MELNIHGYIKFHIYFFADIYNACIFPKSYGQ